MVYETIDLRRFRWEALVAATPQTPRAAPRSVKGAAPRSPGPSQSHAQRFQGLKRTLVVHGRIFKGPQGQVSSEEMKPYKGIIRG